MESAVDSPLSPRFLTSVYVSQIMVDSENNSSSEVSALTCLLIFQMWSPVPTCQWLWEQLVEFCSLWFFKHAVVYFHRMLCVKAAELYWRCFVVFLPRKKFFSNRSVTGCWMTEVTFFSAIISTAGIMHICMWEKRGFTISVLKVHVAWRNLFP